MAGTLRDDLLPLIDELRGLPGELGFRPYKVWVRTTTWSGTRPGDGSKAIQDIRLLVGGGQDPKVREVHRKDVIAGDTAKVDAEYDIGPLTPEFSGGGVSEGIINPQRVGNNATEVLYVIQGPGMPVEGLLCERIADHVDRSLRLMVRVKAIGRRAY